MHEWRPEHGEQPEAIGEQDVVKQFPHLGIGRSRVVFANGLQERGIRVALVSDQTRSIGSSMIEIVTRPRRPGPYVPPTYGSAGR